ncbi:NlpC/P60 family protein [Streptomyces roseicoloratus]|uniref:NlpC/P60 family protein n=1 Tax=Streptomyces roseicoloratus TaxID=2508722 RepID=A0ABY9RZ74_9ACTN|nr:C40 family peptidase [Streptomyces roseicoloratus]WMX47471.1 NlpC/P60 family protein [Streptomyces roseicoloratus]
MASHRRPARVTVLTAAAATAATALGAVPAHADPGGATPESTRATVDRLFEEAERATEGFNRADEKADRLRKTVSQAQDGLARAQERINRMRGALGSVAGAQYRSGGVDPALALLLSSDPDSYLERASVLDRVTARQGAALDELKHELRRLAQQRAEAGRSLAELERSRSEVARHKRTVERKLAEARRVLASLSADERAGFERASRSGRAAFDEELPPLADLGPSRAAAAVIAARSAIGKPYVWGATGPSAFDCSGLMVWSYRQAGIALPRTSQAQRNAGRRVPLSQAQPGDLVTYRGDASHVAIYAGNGQVIHAPYPGARVRYDPVNMMSHVTVTRV